VQSKGSGLTEGAETDRTAGSKEWLQTAEGATGEPEKGKEGKGGP